MRTFILTSDKFAGEVRFEYTDDGYLNIADYSGATLSIEQRQAMVKRTRFDVREIGHTTAGSSAKLTEIAREITFEDFWKKYDDKLSSSRKRALAKWEKMSEKEQLKAYNFVRVYFNNIPTGTRKKYAEKYLNDELWNN
jgi:hypothetical protein